MAEGSGISGFILGAVVFGVGRGGVEWVELGGTSHGPGAAESYVAAALDVVEFEAFENGDAVVHWVFVVPLISEAGRVSDKFAY